MKAKRAMHPAAGISCGDGDDDNDVFLRGCYDILGVDGASSFMLARKFEIPLQVQGQDAKS
jgi:hypothetical protein